MKTLTGHPTSDDPSIRFPSFSALRAAHGNLLKLYREAGDREGLVPNIQTFVSQGKETGALIDDDGDRLAAQGLLDYWVSVLLRSGYPAPNSTLADFDIDLSPELNEADCPYCGLDAFREEDAGFFYGRQRLVTELLEALASRSMLAVVGDSGSGKSSVVRGGFIPKLKAGALPGSGQWHYFSTMVPGSNPLHSLVRLLQPECLADANWMNLQLKHLEANPNDLPTLVRQVAGEKPTVLVIDQFEEVFTLCQDLVIRRAFIDSLVALIQVADPPQHYVILTMRSDFESQVATLPQFWTLFQSAQVRVFPLDAGELREAIEAPAAQVGLKFEDGVVDQLIADVLGEPAALPLLQFMLLQLWEHRDRNRVTYHAYQQLGGGRRALAHRADEVYSNLIPEDQDAAKHILLKMVRPSMGLEVTNNRIRRQELDHLGIAPDRIQRVLDKLCKARLVRQTDGETPEDTQIEIAHEALIRNWPQLMEWLDEERVTLRQRLHLTDTATQWQRRGYPDDLLLKGILLEEAQQYQDLTPLETKLVHTSQRERVRKARVKVILIGSTIFVLSCLSLGLTASLMKTQAQYQVLLKKQEILEAQIQKTAAANSLAETIQDEAAAKGVTLQTQVNAQSAREYEIAGFEALLAGDLDRSREHFGQAYQAFPTYHSVDEIYHRVLTPEAVDNFNQASSIEKGEILRGIYQTILSEYSGGSPPSALAQMRTRLRTRLDTKVEYFPRATDSKPEIGNALIGLGFSVSSLSSPSSTPLNALWFSDQVDIDTVKLTATVLLEQGVELQTIQPFAETSNNRSANKIQIGGNSDANNCSALWTVESVQAATAFTRANFGCRQP